MSEYYNPTRGSKWNYGGDQWKLSRSKIDLFMECPRCFYIDNKLGVKRVPGFPFALNSVMDSILKARYDKYRANNTFPPEAQELTEEGIEPFADLSQLNDW